MIGIWWIKWNLVEKVFLSVLSLLICHIQAFDMSGLNTKVFIHKQFCFKLFIRYFDLNLIRLKKINISKFNACILIEKARTNKK